MLFPRRVAGRAVLASAAVVGLMAAAPPADAAGTILCASPYLCLQTVSTTKTIADINAWADTKSFYGYFYIQVSFGKIGQIGDSPEQTWPAGGKHYTFVMACKTGVTYTNEAVDDADAVIDSKGFTISSC